MADVPATYPDLSPQLRDRSLLGVLAIFGPGAIVASTTIGSGETVFASRGGAIFAYSLFWCLVAGTVLKGIQVYSGARFITLTGRHPIDSWMELPGPRGWFVWFLAPMSIVWMPFWLGGGLPKMLGEFTNWVVGYPDPGDEANFILFGRLWATFFIVVAIAFTWLQSYRFLERVQTTMVALLLFCVLVAAAASGPDLLALITGTLIPRPPQYGSWLLERFEEFRERSPWVEIVTYMGAIGGGTHDYIGYLGMLREKAWGMMGWGRPPRQISEAPHNTARGLSWLRAPRIDVGISFLCILVFTVCFAVLGATILYPRHEVPTGFDLLSVQAQYLIRPSQSPLLQVLLGIIFKTGIFFAFFGTIYGAYELYTRTTRECLTALFPRLWKVPLRRIRFWTLLWVAVPGLGLLWLVEKDPVVIVTPAALVGSGLTCGLWCFAMLWSDRRHLPGSLRMRWPLWSSVLVAGVVLTLIPMVGIIEYVKDLF